MFKKWSFGGRLETVEIGVWFLRGVLVCLLVLAGAAGIVLVGDKLQWPIWKGWGIVLLYYFVIYVILVIFVRIDRQISVVFRVVHHVAILVVPVFIVTVYALGIRAVWGIVHERHLPTQDALVTVLKSVFFGGQFRGVGIFYLGVFIFMSRLMFKLERDAASAAPLTLGDTRARSATIAEMEAANLFDKSGSFLGLKEGKTIRVPFTERLIVAQQGGGKSTGSVVPAMYEEWRTVAATDLKGELVAVCCNVRCYLGEDVPWRTIFVLDPYGVTDREGFVAPGLQMDGRFHKVAFNPFWRVDISDTATVDRILDSSIDAICAPLSEDEGENAKHFFDLARILIRGIAWSGMVSAERGETLTGEIIDVSPAWILDVIVHTGGELSELIGWLRGAGRYGEQAATALSIAGDRERGSIYTSALRRLAWVEDVNMRRVVTHTSLNFGLLNAGLADLFIVLPADQTISKAKWVQSVAKGLHVFLETQDPKDRPDRDWLLLYEELGQFGYIRAVEESWSRIRGFGARMWVVFQRRGQMKVFEDPDCFESAGVIQIFGTQDKETLTWACEVAGKRRILKAEVNEGGQGGVAIGGRGGASMQGGRTIKEDEAAALTQDVVRGLGYKNGIALVLGVAQPIIYDITRYFEYPKLFPNPRANPLEASKNRKTKGAWERVA